MKKVLALLLVFAPAFAQAMQGSELVQNDNDPTVNYLIVICALLALVLLLMAIQIRNMVRLLDEKAQVESGKIFVRRTTWLDLFRRGSETQNTVLAGHEVDGITEFDNPPPAWFNWLFYGTIAFAACYMLYYHVFKIGDLQIAEYNNQMKSAEVVVAKAQDKAITLANEPRYTTEDKLTLGKVVFKTNCVVCHGPDGQGLVGPNLTDEYWLHGGSYPEIFKTIFNGVPDKGMLSWKKSLKPEEIREVASYVYTLRGTNPPNPKAPQGVKYSENATNAPVKDSTASKAL